jgi:glycosyltransferase involved in cell wall biosynthesis
MKIVQVIHGFPPENMAGSEVYTYNLARELMKRHRVWVFYRIADSSRGEFEMLRSDYDGIPVCKINNLFRTMSTFTETYRNDVIAGKFGEFLDEVKPDIVHFGHITCLSTTCISEAHRRRIPVVYTLHDYWLICPRGQFVRRDLTLSPVQDDASCVQCMAYQLDIDGGHERVHRVTGRIKPGLYSSSISDRLLNAYHRHRARAFFRGQSRAMNQIQERTAHIKEMCAMVDQFISPSRFLKMKYVQFGIPENKILYSDNGMRTGFFSGIKRLESDRVRFGFIGSIMPTKGVHVLIKAFNRLSGSLAELQIFGNVVEYDGVEHYGDYLKNLVRNPRVSFMGGYDNRRIGEVLAQVDVVIVPSVWYENSPLTIHEAFLAGAPVIASETGPLKELIRDGHNGLLFEMGNDADLARKMEMLISQPARIKALAKNIGSLKTIQENAAEIESLYSTLLRGGSSEN